MISGQVSVAKLELDGRNHDDRSDDAPALTVGKTPDADIFARHDLVCCRAVNGGRRSDRCAIRREVALPARPAQWSPRARGTPMLCLPLAALNRRAALVLLPQPRRTRPPAQRVGASTHHAHRRLLNERRLLRPASGQLNDRLLGALPTRRFAPPDRQLSAEADIPSAGSDRRMLVDCRRKRTPHRGTKPPFAAPASKIGLRQQWTSLRSCGRCSSIMRRQCTWTSHENYVQDSGVITFERVAQTVILRASSGHQSVISLELQRCGGLRCRGN